MTTMVRRDGKPLANLSRFHPDYGLTMAEHLVKKAKRAAGKEKFVSKEKNRERGLRRR